MPIQRRVRTPAEIEAAEKTKLEERVIQPQQVAAVKKLYFRDADTERFILALRDEFPSVAGETTDVLEIAKAVRKPFKRTCELLIELQGAGIGRPATKRMILNEDRPFKKFYWKVDLHEVLVKVADSLDVKTPN